ncbi:MAG: helix-turn-helix transcriptional regulator [Lachnospiraceae bacterium]
MNLFYLLKQISYQLHTHVRLFDHSQMCKFHFCAIFNEVDPLSTEQMLQAILLKTSEDSSLAVNSVQNAVYTTIRSKEGIFLIGPNLIHDTICQKNDLSYYSSTLQAYQRVPKISLTLYSAQILLLYNLLHQEEITANAFIHEYFIPVDLDHAVNSSYSESLFHHREAGVTHNPYDQEKREVESIRSGDEEGLLNSWNEDYEGVLGILAKDPLRHNKNLGIVLVTLGSRAAMEGGVIPELAYSLSDIYINRIEEAKNPEEAFLLGRDAELHYTRMVREYRSSRKDDSQAAENHHISKCKDYIFSHLHDKLTVIEIADHLNLNSSYLSSLFKKWEMISITDFILSEKVKLAQNMLIYSQYDFIEIATYLGFSSQSHLGKVFRKYTGMTPGAYRNTKGVR